MEFGEQRYLKLLDSYTYHYYQSPISNSFRAKVDEFHDLFADGPWPAKAAESLKILVLKRLQEMDANGEKLPGDTAVPYVTNKDNPSEYQVFLTSNMDKASVALMIAAKYAAVEGEHHKTWVIDQMIRALTGNQYEAFIEHAGQINSQDHGEWDEGNVP